MSDQGGDAGNGGTEAPGSAGSETKTSLKLRLTTSEKILAAANEVLKNSVAVAPAATGAAPPPTPSPPTGQCCDAYPGEALKEALSMPVDSKTLAEKDVPADARPQLLEMNKPVIDARVELLKKAAWATAPEMVLLEACPEGDRAGLAKRMLEVRSAITDTDIERREAEAKVEIERAKTARVAREILEVGKAQMEKWTTLADKGKEMLVATTAFSAVLIVITLIFASEGKLDGTETPIIIFILAIFAISPAVLLLLERPLEGLDKFTPGGTAGGDSDSAAAGGSGEGTAK